MLPRSRGDGAVWDGADGASPPMHGTARRRRAAPNPESLMRPMILFGIVLVALGGFLLIQGGTFTTKEKVIDIGAVEVTADDDHPIPRWAGWVVLAVGAAAIAGGASAKRRA